MTPKNFLEVTINILKGKPQTVTIEKGCSFENNGKIYRVNNDCKLAIWDKAKQEWTAGNEITMTSYQFDTFEAVANNDKKKGLSKEDIDKAIELQKQGKLKDDLQENLKNGYEAQNPQRYTNNHAISAFVTNGNKNTSANLIFKYGEAADALKISELVNKSQKAGATAAPKPAPAKTTPQKPSQAKPAPAKATTQTKPASPKRTTKKPVSKPYVRNNPTDVKKLKPSKKMIEELKKRETLVLYAYDDKGEFKYDPKLKKRVPVPFTKGMELKGTLTIGYGHTGKDVKPGQTISKKKADALFKKDIKKFEKTIRDKITVKLTQNEYDALMSFSYNTGLSSEWKLVKYINEEKFDLASNEFRKFIYSKGKPMKGLARRRAYERKLFRTP